MFGKPAQGRDDSHAERSPRVTHTPGAYPPLSPRNDLRSDQPTRGQESAPTPTPPAQPAPAAAPATPSSVAQGAAAVSASPMEAHSRLIVGPDVKLKGAQIHDCDTLVVEGRVEATLDSRLLRIAEHGAFAGKVGIDVAEIHGEFDGDLTAREQLMIRATGRVSGTIRYGSLLIEAGGRLSGDVQALEANPKPNPHHPVVNSEKEVERTSNVKALISPAV